MRTLIQVLVILFFVSWNSVFAADIATNAPTIRPLTAADARALFAQRPEKPRVIASWSIDCAYCHQNLKTLADEAKKRRSFELILVAIEPIESAATLASLQKKLAGRKFTSYAVADATMEQFRYAIDPAWAGEMPRTWFIGADGSRQSYSGVVKGDLLSSWLSKPRR